MTTASSDLRIQKGSILIYRVFDIGEEVNLRQVESILRREAGKVHLSLARRSRSSIIMRNPPLRLALGEVSFQLSGRPFKAEAVATVWDYGAISILLQVEIASGTPWAELVAQAALIDGGDGGVTTTLDELARAKATELFTLLRPAIQRPQQWEVFEDYVIFFLQSVEGIGPAAELMEKAEIPRLILGEASEPLAEKSRQSILETYFQYTPNDLVVIDWNSAVVVEPSGQREITDILEFALTHLLELRYFDELLDRRLSELYDAVELRRRRFWPVSYAALLREANTRFIEFSEFTERVDNSLKVVGDFYLAVIFRASLRRFRIQDWQRSITRKMNLLAQVSGLLQGEVNVQKSYMLEMVVILLIAFEIISALLRRI